jgi:DNA-binding NarL/FixJ family response regulator
MNPPKIAIIDPNTLAFLGLKQMLQSAMPMLTLDGFQSFEQLMEADYDQYFHYFVAQSIVVSHRSFFLERRHKTIVMTIQKDTATHLNDFRSVCVCQTEHEIIRSMLQLMQSGHANGKNLPPMPKSSGKKVLSDREVEVLSLIAQGKINKEIADQLNISLTTVITHRKNIIEKLGLKSVSALTMYAVIHGYVEISKI